MNMYEYLLLMRLVQERRAVGAMREDTITQKAVLAMI